MDADGGIDLTAVWLALGLVLSIVIGAFAGVLSWLSDHDVPGAVIKGGGAFAGTVALVILIITIV
jgi:hypothetical protein